ncbi:hypothetical protein CVT25_011753 [Psilocybe cyanescens]|uniref:Derlin n=1 Tax=Psilocybe cyanescens TaxID=93625 RepID=A0A409WIE1_PSICY|nr:hypothetical protein CVT25_011753 [Psilocybe cyanescens]
MPTFVDQLGSDIMKLPPVTRFISGSALAVTLAEIGRYVDHSQMTFQRDLVFRKFQLWRLYTSFFSGNAYGRGFNFFFEFSMLYRTMKDLETKSYPQSPADLVWQLFWACFAIIIATWHLNIQSFSRPFLLCIVYLQAAFAEPGAKTSLYGFFTIPVIYYPIGIIGFDLFLGGPKHAAPAVAGAIVGHLWWWIVWEGRGATQIRLARYARAPEWLVKLLGQTRRAGRTVRRD